MRRYREGEQERRTAAEKLDVSRQSTQQGRGGGAAGTERGCRRKFPLTIKLPYLMMGIQGFLY